MFHMNRFRSVVRVRLQRPRPRRPSGDAAGGRAQRSCRHAARGRRLETQPQIAAAAHRGALPPVPLATQPAGPGQHRVGQVFQSF